MKNFEFLFAAFLAAWAIFFLYDLSIGRRLRDARNELARLKSRLEQK